MPRGVPRNGINRAWFKPGSTQARTPEPREKLRASYRNAWATKRQRLPVGSKWVDRQGYVRVKVVEGTGYWVPEHILIVEKMLGREMAPNETIHHIDIVPSNNAPENLHVFADNAAHAEAHRSLSDLVPDLLADGIITFDRVLGIYRRT